MPTKLKAVQAAKSKKKNHNKVTDHSSLRANCQKKNKNKTIHQTTQL